MQRKRALVGVDTSCCPCPWARKGKSEKTAESESGSKREGVIVVDSVCLCVCVNKTQMSLYCLQNHWGRHDFDLAPRNWFMTHFPPLLSLPSATAPPPQLLYNFYEFLCVCLCLCCHFRHKRLKQLRILLECFLIVFKVFCSCLSLALSLSLFLFRSIYGCCLRRAWI